MTHLLQQALTEVTKLSEMEQDAIAVLILDEISDDRQWDEEFGNSQDKLADLAEKVRQDIKAGRIQSGGFDQL